MENEKCDLIHPNGVNEKKLEVVNDYTIKYHANGKTIWSKGKMIEDKPGLLGMVSCQWNN